MICKNCGTPMGEGDLFCQKCGTKNEPVVNDVSTEDMPTVIGEKKDVSNEAMPTVVDDKNVTVIGSVSNDVTLFNEMLKDIWPDWTIVKKLGEGSFGKVYKAERNEMGTTFTSAIKIITIPHNDSEVETIRSEVGLDEQSSTAYFRALVDDCVNEIKMMESFKGIQNIVSVEDYKVVPHKNRVGWTILIRMELLTSFTSYTKDKVMTEKDVIKLGIDMCNALECCAKLNVMHRDIKPENIFVSSFGDYKLGDFGIARKLEKSTTGMSKKGTYNYMAPEIYSGNGQYDYKSDIYSLGIVLYKLLNNNRFPLVDARSNAVTYQQMQDAFDLRMSGARLPKPMAASDALANVILAACAHNPSERFSSASALKAALMGVQSGKADKMLDSGTVSLPANTAPKAAPKPVPQAAPQVAAPKAEPEKPQKPKKQKKEKKKMSKGKKALIIISLILVLLIAGAGVLAYMYFTGTEYKIIKALENEDFEAAAELYDTDMDGDASKMLINSLESRLEKIKNEFTSEAISFEVANMEIATIKSFDIPEINAKIEETEKFITDLNTSRTAFATAEKCMQEEEYAVAIENYKKVIESDANYETAKTKLDEAIGKYRTVVLGEAAQLVEDGDYSKALATLENALKIVPGDSEITGQLEIYKSAFKDKTKTDAFAEAKNYVENGDYASALDVLGDALELFPDDAEIKSEYDKYKKEYEDKNKQAVLDSAKVAADEGDYITAINLLKEAQATLPDDKDIANALNGYIDAYKKKIMADADALVAAKKFTDAVKLISGALEVLPEDEDLLNKKTSLENNMPVYLNEVVLIDSGRYKYSVDVFTDSFGNDYDGYHWFSECHDHAYAVYNLDGKYKEFDASIVAAPSTASDKVFTVAFYVDGKLMYTVKDFTKTTGKQDVTIDVTGATKLEIKTSANDWYGNDNIAMVDAMLLK